MTNKVTEEDIDTLLDSAHTEETFLDNTYYKKVLSIDYQIPLRKILRVTGRAGIFDPDNFDIEVCRHECRAEAALSLLRREDCFGYLSKLRREGIIFWNKTSD